MSNNNLFAIFDTCSGIFGDPIVASNEAAAKRFFEYYVAAPNVPDYVRKDSVLYCIGFFDNTTGVVDRDFPPYVVARGCNVQPRPRDEVISNEE